LDELKGEGLADINHIYNTGDYKKVIKRVKAKTKEIAARKIKELQELLK